MKHLSGHRNPAHAPRLRAIVPLVLGATMLTACDGQLDAPSPSGNARSQPPLVATQTVTRREISNTVEAIGTTRANESVTLTAKVTDTVSAIHFEDGDYVEAGAVLVELTNEEEQALLAEARANVNDARTQLKRLEDLLTQSSVPVSQVDEARSRFNGSQARYQSIVARLDDRLIRAPFQGLLGFRQISAGTLLSPNTAITTLDDVTTIKLDFSLPEVHLGLVAPDQRLIARSAAFPNREFAATVRTIGSRVDPVTRAAVIRAHIDNADLMLKPGMLMTVALTTAVRRVLMVPESAVTRRGNQVYVYTVENGTAVLREISTGVRRDGWVELLDGLAEDEVVISEGIIKIRDGSPIRTAARRATELAYVAV